MARDALLALLAAALLSGALALMPRDPNGDYDPLPGWKSQTFVLRGPEDKTPRMEVLNAEARIFLFHNFLTPEECDHVVGVATPRLERSGVVASKGGSEISGIRTSSGMFMERGEDEVISDIEERIARWTLLPVGNGEGLQKEGLSNGGNRYATVLMYLADVEEGGETAFPEIPAPSGVNEGFSECASKFLAAKPRKGDAVLFHSMKPNGELERRSLHTACPVTKGIKWSMAKWIHVGHYAMGGEEAVANEQHPQKTVRADGCEDTQELCESWAAEGECEKNKGFMIGTRNRPGACLLSCNHCELLHGGMERLHRKLGTS